MSSEWPIERLSDCCEKIGSGATPRGGKDSYLTDGPVKLIRSQNIHNDGFSYSGLAYISNEQAEKLSNVSVQADDVLLNITGDSVARVCQALEELLPARVNQHVAIIRPIPQKLNAGFLRYFLAAPTQQDLMLGLASAGGTRNALTKAMIESFQVPCPPIAIQRGIALILKLLDDRIALLRETNQTLESIAQALFKSWFVDFDPVRAKADGKLPDGIDAETAVLFPDAFEESELGMVPKGWVIGRLIDFAKLKGGKMLSKEHFSVDGEFPVYGGAGEMGRSNLSNAEGFVITVGRVGAYCGQYFWHSGKAWVNNNASHVIPHNVNYSVWLYQWLRSVDMDLIKKGAAQPFVSNGDIENLKIILPAASAIEEFVNVCEPLFKRMSSGLASISTLTNLRETLLPRLISGQLRIADAEAELEKAIA